MSRHQEPNAPFYFWVLPPHFDNCKKIYAYILQNELHCRKLHFAGVNIIVPTHHYMTGRQTSQMTQTMGQDYVTKAVITSAQYFYTLCLTEYYLPPRKNLMRSYWLGTITKSVKYTTHDHLMDVPPYCMQSLSCMEAEIVCTMWSWRGFKSALKSVCVWSHGCVIISYSIFGAYQTLSIFLYRQ